MESDKNPFAAPLAHDEPVAVPAAVEDPIALNRVRQGLLLVYIAICGVVVSFFVMIGLPLLVRPGGDQSILALFIASGFAIIGLYVVQLIGVGLCIFSPPASGARSMAQASLGLQILAFALMVAAAFILPTAAVSQWAEVIVNLIFAASAVFFLLCMWRLADYVDRKDVALRAKRTLIAGLFFLGVFCVASFTMGATTGADNEAVTTAAGIGVGVGSIGMLIAVLMYANTATYLRRAIGEAIAASDPS